MRKVVKWTGVVVFGLVVLALLAGVALYPIGVEKLNRTFPGIPIETVSIPTEADAVARGSHIATVWGCNECHGPDLSGMLLADDPILGTLPASNLTSGKGGIGGTYSDADWIRAIRHGIKPNGRVEIFMYDYYSTMSDQDLGALIAYLKQIPPVDSEYPPTWFGPIFPIAPAVGLFVPAAELIDHGAVRPADPVAGDTITYGKYLSVLCSECHGNNLANKLQKWTQEDFVRAIKMGILPDGRLLNPAMSSATFGKMNETELAALWLYLQSLSAGKS